MGQKTIEVDDFPEDILKVDDWFSPQIGELCFNNHGHIDIVKNIEYVPAARPFNAFFKATLESGIVCSTNLIYRIEVKRGKVFVFKGKPFVHQEALCGDYTDKLYKNIKLIDTI